MLILKKIYTLYGLLVFTGLFLILFPAFLFFIAFPRYQRGVHWVNMLWARVSFLCLLIPVKTSSEEKLSPKDGPFVFCANHFSLIDIITFGFINVPLRFMGKNSLANIPLFGYMYKKLHITVKRRNARDGLRALDDAKKAIDEGFSVVIFPEGGIYNHNSPEMVKFKDGAFRLAIEKQIPIVPVTFPDNWIILPDNKWPPLTWCKLRVHVHKPISTKNMGEQEIKQLKEEVYQVIQHKLDESSQDESRKRYIEKNCAPGTLRV